MRLSLMLVPLLAAASLLAPADAAACGGCIYPQGPSDAGGPQTPSVITDHRMALALTPTMTTLWDQVQYAGDPAEFAWLLPVRGAVTVGIGSDNFLTTLDQTTAPRILPPRVRCDYPTPPPVRFDDDYQGSSGCGCMGSASKGTSDFSPTTGESADGGGGFGLDAAIDEGVIITDRTTVGPYETVQIRSDDPDAIFQWLTRNKYAVPPEVAPIIGKYAAEKFDFVAIKLRPGAGVTAMRPIRVSWKGADPRLPLRMVAAGVGAQVGLKLFVIGDGRWRTKNFPTYSIDPGQLSWDFNVQRSNYTALRDRGATGFDNRAWALESSIDVSRSSIPAPEPLAPVDPPADAGSDATTAETGSADTSPEASGPSISPTAPDAEIAFGTFASRRVTRLRADLPVRHLDTDLVLEADENQATLGVTLQTKTWTNGEFLCPGGGKLVSSFGASGPPATLLGPARTEASCALQPTTKLYAVPVGLTFGLAALGLARRARRHRR